MTDEHIIEAIVYREVLAFILSRDDADETLENVRIAAENENRSAQRLWSLWTAPRN